MAKMEFFKDINGNRKIRLQNRAGRSFSIQTNGLKISYSFEVAGATWEDCVSTLVEVRNYIYTYGTLRQRNIMRNVCIENGIEWDSTKVG